MLLLPISHRQQRQQAECLVACAAMVLAHLNISVSYENLLKRLRIGPAGAPYRNLLFLEKLGVSVLIKQGYITTLRATIQQNLPVITFVNTGELPYWNEATNHAVVVVGFEGDEVYLNDPRFADAPRIVSVADFDLAWLDMDEFYAVITKKS